MSKLVKISKGLDIKLIGESDKVLNNAPNSKLYAIKPADFHGLTPKMVVKEGEKVKAGTIIFFDKYNDVVKFASPVSGTLKEIRRGEKRRILEVIIEADNEISYEEGQKVDVNTADAEKIKEVLLNNGLWPFIKQRPIDIIANPKNEPKAIFISAFDSAPLAPDYDFVLKDEKENFQTGVNALAKLTKGKVHLNVRGDVKVADVFNVNNVQVNKFVGPHPAGNVGIQIHHIDPINKGEYVWVVNPQDVAIIGRYLNTGKFDLTKIINLAGSEIKSPRYYKVISGATVADIIGDNLTNDHVRYISGNPLTGDKVDKNGFLGFYHNQITVIPEGDRYKFFLTEGWLSPGFKSFSASRAYCSWLMPNKKYRLDTNLNGEERAFVVSGQYEKVLPMDIYPVYLVKSIITNDIDGMEKLGIYEVSPEDFALCEFVCTSKINVQDIIRNGLDVVQKECL